MSVSTIATALKSAIQPLLPTEYKIVRNNEVVSDKFYIRMTEFPMQPSIITRGQNRITQHQGMIQFDCIMPIGKGDTTANTLLNTILANTTFGMYDVSGFKFNITLSYEMPGHLSPRSVSPDKYIKSVIVEYNYYE